MNERERTRRNLNPHQEARLAMVIWGKEYSQQRGGSMEFWDALSDSRKRLCREVLDEIHTCPRERGEGGGR